MKRGLVGLCVGVLVLLWGGGEALMQMDTVLNVVPDKAFYRPGETVRLRVTASHDGHAVATITHLADTVAVLEAPLEDGSAVLAWTPPAVALRGYGVSVRLREDAASGAHASTAFDVLERWTQAPRYGFLSEFGPGRDNADATLEGLLPYHVNGLQFYDWQYRHETLLPPAPEYTDLLGRRLSLEIVEALIAGAHARNIAAMPYTAIYGASPAFYRAHPDWALFQPGGDPFAFGGGLLMIMDPSPGSPWNAHLLREFARVLDHTAFDGIHIDQYGTPQVGRNAAGARVDLAEVFPAFIDQTAALVEEQRGSAGAVIFNAVGNWPTDTVAAADQDAVYIEVWDPYRDLLDLHRLIVNAQARGGGKPVILAAYISPERVHNVRLANAIIFGSGAYHLELGEPGAMLADPYFPRSGLMDAELQSVMRHTYDFAVRYEEVLALNTTDATAVRAADVTIDGYATRGLRSRDRIAILVRQGPDREAFSLVNLVGIDTGQWSAPIAAGPTPLEALSVQIRVERPVARAWWASPDHGDLSAQPLQVTPDSDAEGAFVSLVLPALEYWSLIVLEYAP